MNSSGGSEEQGNESDEQITTVDFYGTEITSSDAAEFLNFVAKGDQSCPVCRSNNWLTAFGPGDGSFMAIPSRVFLNGDSSWPKDQKHFPVFAFVCGTCGNTRLHALSMLSDWIQGGKQ